MSLKSNRLITFFYYENLNKAADFYQNVMGFKLVQDQSWAKIFQVAENAYVGCVDGNVGYQKPSKEKPVMLTVVVDDPDAWFRKLQKHDVNIINEPHDDKELNLRIFLIRDPEGYVIELQKFYAPFP